MIRDRSPWGRVVLALDAAVMRATGETDRCPARLGRWGREWSCRRRYGHPGHPGDERRPGSHVWRDDGPAKPPGELRGEIHEGRAG